MMMMLEEIFIYVDFYYVFDFSKKVIFFVKNFLIFYFLFFKIKDVIFFIDILNI